MSATATQSSAHYRPDIDGLRALAVIPVILFHLGLGCPGGYVGVDVFFVISGFLITSIILREITAGTFSLAGFWVRRIRRILPTLFVVVIATLIGAGFVLYPHDYRLFGKEVISQAALVANFYFWQQDGYFDAPAEKLALLHTWSLAVEEQFYLLFPFLLGLLHQRGRALLKWTAALAVISFAWSAVGVHAFPRASFYLLPARAWELLLGSLLALWQVPNRQPFSKSLSEASSWLGLGLILYAVATYSTLTQFPGPAALAPCLGTALLIASNNALPTIVGRALSLSPFVLIGKISYSLYLWHWPMIVLYKATLIHKLTFIEQLALLLASVVLAWLTWRYVETPFRKPSTSSAPPKRVFQAFAAVTLVPIALGTLIYKNDGFKSRFSPTVLQYMDAKLAREPGTKKDLLENGAPPLLIRAKSAPDARTLPILIWGDSHARSILHLCREACRESGTNIYASAFAGTPPLLGALHPPRLTSREYNDAVITFIQKKQIETVILVGRWTHHAIGAPEANSPPALRDYDDSSLSSKDAFRASFARTIHALEEAGVSVWVMKQVPDHNLDLPSALATATRFPSQAPDGIESLGVTIEEHLEFQKFTNEIIDSHADDFVTVLDPISVFRTANNHCRLERDGHSFYHDSNHLSDKGSLELRPLFEPLFRTWHSSN